MNPVKEIRRLRTEPIAPARTEPNARKKRDLLGAGVEGRTWHECTHERALRARIGGAVEGVVSAPTNRTQARQKPSPGVSENEATTAAQN